MLQPKPCIFCVAEMPHEITEGCDEFEESGIRGDSGDTRTETLIESDSDDFNADDSISVERPPRPVGRPPKESGEDMSDVLSTGRKRAVAAAPITKGMVCEWSRLEKAGGGVEPIAGCPGFPAADVHHGPDKSVLNNEVGVNLHRVCHKCHHRWHEANDKYYEGERPPNGEAWIPSVEWSPHDSSGKRMTMAAALMLEATRQQDDRRGK